MSRVSDLEAALEMERRIAADNLAAYDAAIDREARLRAAIEGLDVTDDAAWPIVSRKSLDRLRAALATESE